MRRAGGGAPRGGRGRPRPPRRPAAGEAGDAASFPWERREAELIERARRGSFGGLPSPSAVRAFRSLVHEHFERFGRDLPWRRGRDPWRVLVSEVMLQQTRAERVAEMFPPFVEHFPDPCSLARAPFADVLGAWKGLGYNRRALSLHRAASIISARLGGRVPSTPEELERLTGIGPATARSIAAFAFGRPVAFIETNVRTVILHVFLPDRCGVADAELLPLVEATLDRRDPAGWYDALMDYGAALKRRLANPSRRSAHHARQSPFVGSDRELRGKVLSSLLEAGALSPPTLARRVGGDERRLAGILAALEAEGFIERTGGLVRLAGDGPGCVGSGDGPTRRRHGPCESGPVARE